MNSSDSAETKQKPPVRHDDWLLVAIVALAVGAVIWNEKRMRA